MADIQQQLDEIERDALATVESVSDSAGLESARQDQLIDLARRNIELGQKAGDISESIDAGVAAAAIIGAIGQAVCQAFRDPKPPAPSAVTAQLWGLIAGALGLPTRDPFAQ